VAYYLFFVILVYVSNQEHPNTFENDRKTEESDRHQQPYKFRIILASNAVVKIPTMMVELLHASSASMTVITLILNLGLAELTIN
jgi:hypothetical protein